MSTPTPTAARAPIRHPDGQVRAILRNLTAKTLTYFARQESEFLRLMSEHLLDLAQQPGTDDAQRLSRTASFLLDKQRAVPGTHYQDALKETLQEEVRQALDARQQQQSTPAEHGSAIDGMTLTLIDVSEMDRLLSIDLVTQRFNSHYEAQLSTLCQRLGMLLTGEVIALTANPFRPEVLVRALMLGWKHSGFDDATGSCLLAGLEPRHSIDLGALYEDMNATLAQSGVSVKTTLRILKSGSSSAASSGFADLEPHPQASEPGSFSASPDGTAARAAGRGSDSSGMEMDTGAAGSFAPSQSGALTLEERDTSAAPGRLARLMPSIDAHARQFLQRMGLGAPTDVPDDGSALALADPALMGYLGGLQADGGAALIQEMAGVQPLDGHNVLRQMREHEQIQQATEIDRGTVDALSEVFDYVFADPTIPPQLKVVIGRLQIPVLKAAMIDREFFRSPEHPARRLIDTLAQGSVTWNEDKGKQDPLYQRVEHAVHRALSEFDNDLALFDHLRLEFEQFQNQTELEVQRRIAPVAKVEQSDEALALAKAQADEVVHARINALPPNTPLAPLLLPFLTEQWREVLARAWLKVQTQPEIWNDALATLGQLIWSTQPHPVAVERRQRDPELGGQQPERRQREGDSSVAPRQREGDSSFVPRQREGDSSFVPRQREGEAGPPQERRQLMRVLPDLVRSLALGLDSIRWSGSPREEFMHGLMELHMRAVRTAPPTPLELERRARESQAAQEALSALDLRRAQAQSEPGDEFERMAQALSRGMWFDYLNQQGHLHRCRLSWISPKRTRLLFTNREGFDAFVQSEREVAELLREGLLTQIDQAPIVGRALDQIMAA